MEYALTQVRCPTSIEEMVAVYHTRLPPPNKLFPDMNSIEDQCFQLETKQLYSLYVPTIHASVCPHNGESASRSSVIHGASTSRVDILLHSICIICREMHLFTPIVFSM